MQIPWQQGLDLFDTRCGRQLGERTLKPRVRVEAVGFNGLHNGIEHGAGVGARGGIAKKPCLATDHKGANGILDRIIPRR